MLLAIIFVAIYFGIVSSQLKAEAATYDLSKLEQMESASLILDRNGKIFGQIYVENRETIPYDQLPRDLVNAVVAMEDSKFYQHSGYDLFGIVRAALNNFRRRPRAAGREHDYAATGAQQFCAQGKDLSPETSRNLVWPNGSSRHFGKQKSWSCI